ncbi:DUF397 domain-containing protein [Saccharopolyspora gloriosae]|uniref:DUF397 domain-containing protein n=1 Tax=Saccharopolyspora gloriosae TaxID=455344 RepID=UPI001FB6DCB5|nr:DUF397 domain-containing protein [Saccharopolyspora gloriosae]
MKHTKQNLGEVRFVSHAWRRARRCGSDGANCIEVNLGSVGVVGLRDSKQAEGGPILQISPQHWCAFLLAAGAGHYDRDR